MKPLVMEKSLWDDPGRTGRGFYQFQAKCGHPRPPGRGKHFARDILTFGLSRAFLKESNQRKLISIDIYISFCPSDRETLKQCGGELVGFVWSRTSFSRKPPTPYSMRTNPLCLVPNFSHLS